MGCKNNLYLVMIEAHIKENLMFHELSQQKTTYSLRENSKLIISLEDRVYISLLSKWSQTLYDFKECSILSILSVQQLDT